MTSSGPDQKQQAAQLIADASTSAERSEWEEADARFKQALSLDSSSANRIAYGVFLTERERYFEAISVFTPVLDTSDLSAISIVCHNLAAIYRNVGDLDLARRFQWRSTLLQEDCGPEDLLGLANDALASGHDEVAASLLLAAVEIAERRQEPDADLTAATGIVRSMLNSTKEGLLTLFAAYRRRQATGDLRGMGTDLFNMAFLFGELKRHRAELACLVRAMRCFEQASAAFSSRKARQQLERSVDHQAVRDFDSRRN